MPDVVVNITANSDGVSEGVSQAQSELGKLTDVAGSVGHKFASVLGTAVKIGVVGTMAAAGALAGYAFTKGFQRLEAIDQAQAKLKGLGASTQQVTRLMNNSLASVKGTAFGLDDAVTVAANLSAAGIKAGRQMRQTLKTVADVATIAGSSLADMGSIFNKVAATGHVTGDVIQQLQDRGVPALQFLSKELGKTPAEIQKMVSKGQISFAQFSKAMQDNVGGAALKSGNTFSGALANLQASLGRIGAGLLGGAFKQFAPLLQGITGALSPLEGQAGRLGNVIGKLLAPAFANAVPLVTRFVNYVSKLNFANASSSVGSFSNKFKSFKASVSGLDWASVSQGAKTFASAAKQLAPAFAQIGVKGAGDTLKVFGAIMSEAAKHTDPLVKVLPVLISTLALYKASQAASNLVGKQSLPHLLIATASNYNLAASNRVLASALTQSAAAQGESTAAESVGIVTKVRNTVATVASAVAQRVAGAAARVWAAGQWALNAAMDANPIGLVVLAIAALVAGFIIAYKHSETFRNIVNGAFNAVKTVIASVMPFITGIIKAGWSAIATYVRVEVAIVRAVVTGAWNAIRAVTSAVWSGIKVLIVNPIKAAVSGVRSAASSVKSAITASWNAVKSATSNTWNAIRSIVSNAVNGVMNIVHGIKGRVTGALSGAASWLVSAGKQVIQGFINGIDSMIGAVTSKLHHLTDLIPKHKGPESRDKKLLKPNGQWVVQGLIDGMSIPKVLAHLGKMTKKIKTAVSKAVDAYASTLKDRLSDANGALDAAKGQFADYASSVSQALSGAFNVTDFANSSSPYGDGGLLGGILDNLQKKVSQAQDFAAVISDLKAKGLNKDSLDQIIQAGAASGYSTAKAISDGGATAIASINSLQSQMSSTADTLGNQLATDFYAAGVNAAQGFADGIAAQLAHVVAASNAIAKAPVKHTKKKLKIKSPSRVMAQLGKYTVAGYAKGITQNAKLVTGAMNTVTGAAMSSANVAGATNLIADASSGSGVIYNVNITAETPRGNEQAAAKATFDLFMKHAKKVGVA